MTVLSIDEPSNTAKSTPPTTICCKVWTRIGLARVPTLPLRELKKVVWVAMMSTGVDALRIEF